MTWSLARLFAQARASVYTKLLAAFLTMAALLLAAGAIGLEALGDVNRHAEALVILQRKIAAYHQLQHDTTGQLYSVALALLKPEERTLEGTLRQLNQFGYDLDRLQFVAKDEIELLGRVRTNHEEFTKVVTRVIDLIRQGKAAEGTELQLSQATPLANRLERLTNELVNKAEADMVASTEASHEAFAGSRHAVMAFAAVSIVLALVLGYAISRSLIGPVQQMDERLRQIGAGDFAARIEIPNRDELGALAAAINRMSDELGRLYRQLEAASRHKSEFLANMSHELRTPLNAIIGFSEVLEARMFGELNAKQLEYAHDIYTSGLHLLSLINDILDLSKIEAGKVVLEPARFHLPSAVESTLILVRERAARHGIEITMTVDANVGEIVADERKVRQVLLNLLSNAVKFTPDGGRIDVRAGLVDGKAEVSVADNGIGIAPQDQEVIFEEFRQVGNNALNRREGTGLGLTLARKFVELHGGRIWVQSALGRGSTFTFSLPLQPP